MTPSTVCKRLCVDWLCKKSWMKGACGKQNGCFTGFKIECRAGVTPASTFYIQSILHTQNHFPIAHAYKSHHQTQQWQFLRWCRFCIPKQDVRQLSRRRHLKLKHGYASRWLKQSQWWIQFQNGLLINWKCCGTKVAISHALNSRTKIKHIPPRCYYQRQKFRSNRTGLDQALGERYKFSFVLL